MLITTVCINSVFRMRAIIIWKIDRILSKFILNVSTQIDINLKIMFSANKIIVWVKIMPTFKNISFDRLSIWLYAICQILGQTNKFSIFVKLALLTGHGGSHFRYKSITSGGIYSWSSSQGQHIYKTMGNRGNLNKPFVSPDWSC